MPRGREIRAGKAYVEMTLRDRLRRGLAVAGRRMKAFGSEVRKVGTGLVGVSATIAAPIGLAVRRFTRLGDTMDKMAKRTGLTTNELSEMGFAAEQSGAKLEDVEKSVRTMSRSVTDLGRGLSTQVAAFDRLGLTYDDLRELSPQEQFELIADRLALMETEFLRNATALQIFGRAGFALKPLLEEGAAGIAALRAQAREIEIDIDPDAAAEAAELTDQINILSKILGITLFAAGRAVSPLLIEIVRRVQSAAQSFRGFVSRNDRLVVGLAKLAAVLGGLGVALTGLGATAIVLGGLATGIGAVTVAIPALIVGLTGLVAAFNGGEVAGIDLGKAILRLASDLGILKSAAIELENAENRIKRAAEAVAKAERDLGRAEGVKERLQATERLAEALRRQAEEQEKLRVVERAAAADAVSAAEERLRLVRANEGRGGPGFAGASGPSFDEGDIVQAEQELERAKEALARLDDDRIGEEFRQKLARVAEDAAELRSQLGAAALADDGSVAALEAKVKRLNAEAAELQSKIEGALDTGDSAGVDELVDRLEDVRVRIKVAQGELVALRQQAAAKLVPEIGFDESVFDRFAAFVVGAIDGVKERAWERLDLEFELSLFGADEVERTTLSLKREADELRRSFRELGLLTPEVDAEINDRLRRALTEALTVEVPAETFTVSVPGIADARAVQSLQGGVVDYQQQTAVNTKRTADATEEIARNPGGGRFG